MHHITMMVCVYVRIYLVTLHNICQICVTDKSTCCPSSKQIEYKSIADRSDTVRYHSCFKTVCFTQNHLC